MSEIRATTISDAAGTGPITLTKQSAAKMWCNQDNGTTINGSLNVSSLTDNGAGDYTHNFTSNFANVHYAGSGTVNTGSNFTNLVVNKFGADLVSSNTIFCGNHGASSSQFTKTDFTDVMFHINGDLA